MNTAIDIKTISVNAIFNLLGHKFHGLYDLQLAVEAYAILQR